jgi:hypothetical protein
MDILWQCIMVAGAIFVGFFILGFIAWVLVNGGRR